MLGCLEVIRFETAETDGLELLRPGVLRVVSGTLVAEFSFFEVDF